MKIVGVSFGTRNGMNDSVCKEALHTAELEGAEVSFIHALDWDIQDCTGCVACSRGLLMGKGNICTRKDEFDEFRSQLLDADGILIVGPIFAKGASGLYHTILDRFGPRSDRGINYMAHQMALEGKGKPTETRLLRDRVISYISIGGSDWCTSAEYEHGLLSVGPGWKTIDNQVFPWSKTIFMDDDKVERIKEIGRNLAIAAKDIENAKYLGDGVCPHCHSKNFYIVPDSEKVICCYCGIEGTLVNENHVIKFVFPEEQISHAHDTNSGKAIHARDIGKNEGESTECRKSEKWKLSQERLKSYQIDEILPPSKR